ncbi:MAG: ribose-phosphate diphosphokinase [Nitrospiraceae bacterium]|nr:ribose-phosphate diphosphokinase [Nitrospiraceae bacterium]
MSKAGEKAASASTPDESAGENRGSMGFRRGGLLIAACGAGSYLAARIADRCRYLMAEACPEDTVDYLEDIDFQFSDSETCVRLEMDVSGKDVFVCQALYTPDFKHGVDQNLMSFLIAARAFSEWGASHITAVLPYLAYARQDNPTRLKREPTTAKLIADLLLEAGIDRLITVHPHSKVHGFFGKIPVLSLESLPIFIEEFSRFRGRNDVIAVAPDPGASKFVAEFSRILEISSAMASKYRPRREEAIVHEVIGEFEGKKTAIVLDDMVGTGGTVQALIRKLVEQRKIEEIYLGMTHNLCMKMALEKLLELHLRYNLREVITTDSIPQSGEFRSLPFARIRSLSEFISEIVYRVHCDISVMEGPARTRDRSGPKIF